MNNDTQNKLAFYPFTPTTLPSWSITAADTFARLQEIRSTRNLVESKEALELGSWARKMKFEHKVKRVPLDLNSTKTLTESLNSIDLEGELEIRGEFGNWLLPIFYDGKATKENRNVLAGNFNLESFRKWSNGKEAVFIAKFVTAFLLENECRLIELVVHRKDSWTQLGSTTLVFHLLFSMLSFLLLILSPRPLRFQESILDDSSIDQYFQSNLEKRSKELRLTTLETNKLK